MPVSSIYILKILLLGQHPKRVVHLFLIKIVKPSISCPNSLPLLNIKLYLFALQNLAPVYNNFYLLLKYNCLSCSERALTISLYFGSSARFVFSCVSISWSYNSVRKYSPLVLSCAIHLYHST